jgi:hypothetical protein
VHHSRTSLKLPHNPVHLTNLKDLGIFDRHLFTAAPQISSA